jgi:HK97 family phage portal protein
MARSYFAGYLSSSLATPEKWLASWFNGRETASGAVVNASTAQRLTAVSCALRILSETEAALPLIVYRRRRDGGKDRARDLRIYQLLHNQPNPWQTAFEFRRMMTWHAASRGFSVAEILLRGNGEIDSLIPLNSDRVCPDVDPDGTIYYWYTPKVRPRRKIPFNRLFKLLPFSEDGVTGRSPIEVHREAIGVGMAAEDFAAYFYANQATPSGFLKHPGKLTKDVADKLRAQWQARHGGTPNVGKTAVLEEGMTYEQLGMKLSDAQFLESRKFQVTEIARMYRLPPHMLADLERATFTNIEHQGQEFVTYSMTPWLVLWEQAIWRDLLSEEEQADCFAEHLVDALLRGDTASRYQAYAVGRQWGWLSADDIRDKENMNPLPDGEGKVYLTPMNMVPADQLNPSPSAPKPGAPPGSQGQAPKPPLEALVTLAADPMRRILRREEQLAAEAQKRGKPVADALVGHTQFIHTTLESVARGITGILAPGHDDAAGWFLKGWSHTASDRALARWARGPATMPTPEEEAQRFVDTLTLTLAGAQAAGGTKEVAA